MSRPLRLLIVEDSEDDVALLVRALRRGGYEPTYERVDTPDAMRAAFDRQDWDIVISDYSMPHFSGLAAITLLQERALDVPFILVSGTIGEESAVAAMRAGAHDYLMKDNLTRLAPAVARELREAEVRRARRRAEQQLRQAEVRYRTLVEHIPAITYIIALDSASSMLYVSPQIEAILGFAPEEWMADPQRWLKQLHLRDLERVLADLARAQTSDEPLSAEFRMLSRAGQVVWFRDETVVVRDEVGQPVYLQGVMVDITERQHAEEELRRLNDELEQRVTERTAQLAAANQALEQANRAKDRFLANMSHELRTPLNAIIGFTGTLLMGLPGPLTVDQEKQLRTVQRSAQHLLSLINDLLDLAKIESGNMQLHREPVVCQDVIQDIAESLRPLAETKVLALDIALPDRPISIHADRRALSQIVINLVNNAIKFTEQGTVRVELCQRHVHGRPLIEIRVSDTGIGLHHDDQAKLFQAFTQVDTTPRHQQEGTGLGLHLSQKLANLFGGQITVQSTYGMGSTFTLIIPEG